ncbi:FRIGIDA-like protein 4a [Chenopodium quinoa]|uniref:FRIGIDA-like protein n=1 Tax=Chenopodium quinoa TaxID=63459 RepID=A0A803MT46_CHEQI|nr:FRIGIDA-like protein 4a [Chenopodium quinoa]
MSSIPDPGEPTQYNSPSFEDFQKQTSLMTSCTLLWKELSDHFNTLEEDIRRKSEALKRKIRTLDDQTKQSLEVLKKREVTIEGSVEIAIGRAEESKKVALSLGVEERENENVVEIGEVDDGEGLLMKLKGFCIWMDYDGFWRFVTVRKKELDLLRAKIPLALADCVDPPKFVLEAISEVFPVDKRADKIERVNDLGWACVLLLESLIPVVVDPVVGKDRLIVTPSVRKKAEGIAETWKRSLEERGGIENVKTPDVHTFLQHLVTFGIVKKQDVGLYRKLVVGSAWRKQMPKLAVSLGLGDNMPEMIEELISRGQQVDAVHFTFEVGLVDKFPPVPLLKSFLKDAKKAAAAILEDPNHGGRAAQLANRKEQSALRAVLKCIEEYKLEDEFPPENLKKRLEQLEKFKTDKKKTASVPANKRTRVCNNGYMPPAKAGRSTNAYVSSFPPAPAYVRSPSHPQYPAGVAPYPYDRPAPAMYGSSSPPYPYSPEAAPPAMAGPYSGAPISYPTYGYSNGMAPSYPQVYY